MIDRQLAAGAVLEDQGNEDFFSPTNLGFATAAPAPTPPTWQPLSRALTEQWQRFGIDPTISGINRADELAQILSNYGISDLSKLGLKETPYQVTEGLNDEYGTTYIADRVGKQLTYGDKAFGYLGGIGSKGQQEFGSGAYGLEEYMQDPNLLAWSAAGKGNVSYRTVQDPTTGQVVIVPEWGSSSDWGDFRQIVKLGATMASMGGLGGALGASILPAGTSAAMSKVVGNAVLGGLASGNAKGAILGGVASLVAPVVTKQISQLIPTDLTGVEAVDRAIDSATKNVSNAVVNSVIRTGGMPDIGKVLTSTLIDEVGAELQDSGIIPANVDPAKIIKVAQTASNALSGALTPGQLLGLVGDVSSSLPKSKGSKAGNEDAIVNALADTTQTLSEVDRSGGLGGEDGDADIPSFIVTGNRLEDDILNEILGSDAVSAETLMGRAPGAQVITTTGKRLEDDILKEPAVAPMSEEELLKFILPGAIIGKPPAPDAQQIDVVGKSLEPDFYVTDTGQIVSTGGDIGRFIGDTFAPQTPQVIDVVAPKVGTGPIPSPLDVDEILRTPIDVGSQPSPEAIMGSPPGPAPAPSPAPPPAPAVKPEGKPDWLALALALAGQQRQQTPEEYRVAQIAARFPFGSILDETTQDDLLRIMRG